MKTQALLPPSAQGGKFDSRSARSRDEESRAPKIASFPSETGTALGSEKITAGSCGPLQRGVIPARACGLSALELDGDDIWQYIASSKIRSPLYLRRATCGGA
jgi:hypothetical protein